MKICLFLHFRIKKLAKAIIYHGRQNIPLRGRRDFGPFSFKEPQANDGNFRAYLRQLCDVDKTLKKHLKTCGKNSSHVSWHTQNELITICGDIIKV